MLFSEILGLEKIKKELTSSYSQKRIAHAQLFDGPKGSGKLALALAYAQLITCESVFNNDSCGTCSSCIKYSKLIHPDLHVIFPVIKTSKNPNPLSSGAIDLWRSAVLFNPYQSFAKWTNLYKEQYIEGNGKNKISRIYVHQIQDIIKKHSLKTYEAKYRVVIMWIPEKMNPISSAKFLKLLEEPPKKSIFLLISESKKNLIPTIYSRLQVVNIPSYTVKQTLNFKSDKKTEKFINHCKLSNGDLGSVLDYHEDSIEEDFYIETFSNLMRTCFKNNIVEISAWVDKIAIQTRDNNIKTLNYSICLLRECIIYNYSDKKINNLSIKEANFIKNFSLYIHEENSLQIIDLFEQGINYIKRNANTKIVFFDMLLQLVKLLKLKRKFV